MKVTDKYNLIQINFASSYSVSYSPPKKWMFGAIIVRPEIFFVDGVKVDRESTPELFYKKENYSVPIKPTVHIFTNDPDINNAQISEFDNNLDLIAYIVPIIQYCDTLRITEIEFGGDPCSHEADITKMVVEKNKKDILSRFIYFKNYGYRTPLLSKEKKTGQHQLLMIDNHNTVSMDITEMASNRLAKIFNALRATRGGYGSLGMYIGGIKDYPRLYLMDIDNEDDYFNLDIGVENITRYI